MIRPSLVLASCVTALVTLAAVDGASGRSRV
jgi:hypothetical protein